jgi:hypothetical protein
MVDPDLGRFPPVPEARTLILPGGATLTGMVGLPRGMSEQCGVSFNLMLQLGVYLGNLECLMRVLKFCGWLLEFVQSVSPPDPIKLGQMLTTDLPPIAEDLLECVTAFTPLGICPPIKEMLILIRDFLQCIVEFLESVLTQQLDIGIKLGDAEAQGNQELLEVLQLAQNNAQMAFGQGLQSCEPIFAMLKNLGAFFQLLGVGELTLPSVNDLAGGEPAQAIQPLKDVLAAINAVIDILPC